MLGPQLRLPVLLLAATATAGIQARQWQADARTGLVVGQVVDGMTGEPVAGATVAFGLGPGAGSTDSSPIVPRILTGSTGRFVFRNLPPGSFNVVATKPGYVPGAYGRVRPESVPELLSLAIGDRIGDVVIRLWRSAALAGIVVDEVGDPIVGAIVRPYRRVFRGGARQFINPMSALTDDRGFYRIADLP